MTDVLLTDRADYYEVGDDGNTVIPGKGDDWLSITGHSSAFVWKHGDGNDLYDYSGSFTNTNLTLKLQGWVGDDTQILQNSSQTSGTFGEWHVEAHLDPYYTVYFDGGFEVTGYDYNFKLTNTVTHEVITLNDNGTEFYSFATITLSNADGVICFYPGTLVATPDGPRAVETLAIGDLVLTTEGDAMPVRWMGRQTICTTFADRRRTLPVRISAGALGHNLPERDLLVSPRHALFLDGILVEAGALIGLPGIAQETDVPVNFTYYHLELADHALVLAEGVPAETFVDNASRENFDNWDEHEALYGHLPPIEELDTPRAQSFRQLPRALKARLGALQAA